ncbi:Protein CBG07276 [Caenorhabditis briggsae]|uniref:Protein CBG07276 n=1 Tax=Caenorhabditis briggsae TaxID=6238 RepID=A8X531_CAEBR|nr:Protein CBG07276 [Caenorhabditis briggsae]CAP27742.2 Protein CBG07276 [Caenorhabditis briggsae]
MICYVTACASGCFFEENKYVIAIATGSAIKFYTFGGQDLIPLLTASARERIKAIRFLDNGRPGPQSLVAMTVFGDVYVFSYDDGEVITDTLYTNPEPRPLLETYFLESNNMQIVLGCSTGQLRLWTYGADENNAYMEHSTDNDICDVCLPCQNQPVVFKCSDNNTTWFRLFITPGIAQVLAYGNFDGTIYGTLAIPTPIFSMCLFTTHGMVFHTLDTRHLSHHAAQENPFTMGAVTKDTQHFTRVFGSSEDGDLSFLDLHKNNVGHSTTFISRGTQPSAMSYIVFKRETENEPKEYIFIGSDVNDSQLFLIERDMIYTVVATLENLGPIRDIVERRTRTVQEIVTSSGEGKEGTLRFISPQLKMELKMERFVATSSASRCFAIKTPNSTSHSILICSTTSGTRIFRVSESAEIDEIQQHAFDVNKTLAASNICNSQHTCQVTDSFLRILQYNTESDSWTVLLNQNLQDLLGSVGHPFRESLIDPNTGTIVISQHYTIHTMRIVIVNGRASIVDVCRKDVNDEITCIALIDQSNSPGSEHICSKYFVIGIGGTAPSVFRLTLDLTELHLIVLLEYEPFSILTPPKKEPSGVSPMRLCKVDSVYGFTIACSERSIVIRKCALEETILKIGYCSRSDALVAVCQRPAHQLESIPRTLLNHRIRRDVIGMRYAEYNPQPITTLTLIDARTRVPIDAQQILSSEKYLGMVTGVTGQMDTIAIVTLENVPEAPFKVRLWIGHAARLEGGGPQMSAFIGTPIGEITNEIPKCSMRMPHNQILIHLDEQVLTVMLDENGIQFGNSVPHETPQPEMIPTMFVTCQDTTLHLSHFNFSGPFQRHLRQGLPQEPFFLSSKPTCFTEARVAAIMPLLSAEPILFGTETGSIGWILKFSPIWSSIVSEYERCIDTYIPRVHVEGAEYVSQAVFDMFESAHGNMRMRVMTELNTDGWQENTGKTLQQIVDSIRRMFVVLELE